MKTIWNVTSWIFTGAFLAMLLASFLEAQIGLMALHYVAWTWVGAAGLAFFVGWYSIIWRPIPGKAWNAFVFITANVVFIGTLLVTIGTEGRGFGFSGVIG